jgi:hypothetical protein
MKAFDASSMIYAWDNYPINQFPGLWEWIITQIDEQNLVIPNIALEEVTGKMPECGSWLEETNITQLEITNEVMQDAMRIKKLLGINGDNYHAKGVGENDLLIIATARLHKAELISDEKYQVTLPNEPSKKKIPAVCAMNEVVVLCISFLEFIKRSNEIFR